MKKLQDNLGEYNDLHVQVEKLKDFSTELKNQKTHSEDTVTAMNMLVNHLEELQDSQRTDFARRFEKFSDKTVQKKFKDLFKSSRSIIDEVR